MRVPWVREARLPRGGLIDVERGDGLRLGGIEGQGLIESGLDGEVELEVGRSSRRVKLRGSGGLAHVGEGPADGEGVGEEGDEAQGLTAAGADEREGVVDAGSGPGAGLPSAILLYL